MPTNLTHNVKQFRVVEYSYSDLLPIMSSLFPNSLTLLVSLGLTHIETLRKITNLVLKYYSTQQLVKYMVMLTATTEMLLKQHEQHKMIMLDLKISFCKKLYSWIKKKTSN